MFNENEVFLNDPLADGFLTNKEDDNQDGEDGNKDEEEENGDADEEGDTSDFNPNY